VNVWDELEHLLLAQHRAVTRVELKLLQLEAE
jgi:hypothetical protein